MTRRGLLYPCPYCEHTGKPWNGVASEFALCMSCGLVFRCQQQPAAELSALHESSYTDAINSMTSPRVYLEKLANFMVERYSLSGKSIMDFGAGDGTLVRALRRHCTQVVGVETSDAARQYAKKTETNLLSELPQIGEYDFITAVEVIEHISNPWETLNRLRGLLKRGGQLYLTTPNRDSIHARLRGSSWSEARKPYHVVLFNAACLRRMVVDSGFCAVSRVRYTPTPAPTLTRSLMHRVLQTFNCYGGLHLVCEKPRTRGGTAV